MQVQTSKFQEMIQSDARSIANYASNIQLYGELDVVFAGIDLTCCSYISAYKQSDGGYSVSMWLSEQHKNVKLAVALARKFRCKFGKSKGTDATLELHGMTEDGKLSMRVYGYVPDTCRVVEKEVPLSAAELDARPTTKKIREIQCGRPRVDVQKALPSPEQPVIETEVIA